MIHRSLRLPRRLTLPLASLVLVAGCAGQMPTGTAPQGPTNADALGLNAIYPLQANVVPGQVWLQPAERAGGEQRARRSVGATTIVSQVPAPQAPPSEARARPRLRPATVSRGQNLAQARSGARSGLRVAPPRAGARAPAISPIGSPSLVPVAATLQPRQADDITRRPQLAGSLSAGPVRLLEAELGAGGPLADVKTALGLARSAEMSVALSVPSSVFLQAVHRDMRREAEDFIQCNPQLFNRGRLLAAQRGQGGARGAPVVTIPTTIYYATALDYTFREQPRRVGVRPYTQTRVSAALRGNADLLYALLREHPDLRAKLESAARERAADPPALDGGPGPVPRSYTLTAQFDQPVAWAYVGLSYEILNDQTALSQVEAAYCEAVVAARRERAPGPTIPPELLAVRAAKLRPTSRSAPRTSFDGAPVIANSRRMTSPAFVTLAHLPS
jgi:hypothetical protein